MSTLCLAGLLAVPSVGHALTPPPADKAEIFFNNGGRILSIKADGSDRTVLTRKNSRVGMTGQSSDMEPLPSPDGQTVVFGRYVERQFNRTFSGMMAVSRDGGPVRTVIADVIGKGSRDTQFFPVDWAPDGSRIYAIRYQQINLKRKDRIRLKTALISVKPDGSGLKVVYSTSGSLGKGGPRGNPDLLYGASLAPDGKSALIESVPGYARRAMKLERLDFASGKRTLLLKNAATAAFSPDGSSIVFASERERINKQCDDGYCSYDPQLYVMDADGTGIRRLLKGKPAGSAYSPDWSSDGSRIVFASDRAGPRDGFNSEIWSVAPDGSCLTRLTNGAPASYGPAWGAGTVTGPGTCGQADLRPFSDVTYPKRAELFKPRPLWLGEQFGGLLLDDASVDRNTVGFLLNDCSYLDPRDCRPSLSFVSAPVCERSLENDLTDGSYRNMEFRKGGLVVRFRPRHRSLKTHLLTGGLEVSLYSPTRQRGRNTPGSWHLEAIDALRPLGSDSPLAEFEPPVFAARTIETARTVVRVHRRTGTLRKAARRAGIFSGAGRWAVTLPYDRKGAVAWLRFGRDLNRLGKVKSVKCKRWNNRPGTIGFRAGFGK